MVSLSHAGGMPAFPSPFTQFLFDKVESILRPYIRIITGAAGPYLPTTPELNHPNYQRFQKFIVSPICFILVLVLFIPMLGIFLLRNLLHQFRRPFCLSVTPGAVAKQPSTTFAIATGNLCLMPEIYSKFNNLDNTAVRAKTIGERIIVDQRHYTGLTDRQMKKKNGGLFQGFIATDGTSMTGKGSDNTAKPTSTEFKAEVTTHFPSVDFLCLQETFDRDVSKILIKELHKVYPWIVYDVGYNSPRLNYCGLNSGLMFASKYEILEAQFKTFTKSCGFCSTVSKGMLMVKVCLGRPEPGKQNVGYVFNTHLQAFQGTSEIVNHQLAEIVDWSSLFREQTVVDGDNIMLDVVCGDFNIDNMSPGEAHIARHALFDTYVDVCRERSGKDHPWTVGTEMRNPFLYDEAISTPEGLKAALEDPYLRQRYIIDADLETATMDTIYNAKVKKDEHGNVILTPVGGRRRIDVVLYRKQTPVAMTNYSFVTRLARLTDHIPVCATFQCEQ